MFIIFRIDDIAQNDMVTSLNFVAKRTGKAGNIIYVGHSLGCTIGLMYGSHFPEEAHRLLKMFVLLAPAHILSNMRSPYKGVAPMREFILVIIYLRKLFIWNNK